MEAQVKLAKAKSNKLAIANCLTPKQVADILAVNLYTVYSLLNSGKLAGFRIKTHWRVKQKSLDNFMAKSSK